MGKNSQTHWLHALLPDEACKAERINLTFRFYARESTKHIEGMEHNHEWEAAVGSTRVKLHRGRIGMPVLVDIPNDMVVKQLSRYLSSVLHGFRGAFKVRTMDQSGKWVLLSENAAVVEAATLSAKAGTTPNVEIMPDTGNARQYNGGVAKEHWARQSNNGSTLRGAAGAAPAHPAQQQNWQQARGSTTAKGRGRWGKGQEQRA
jgi:hypothetical protein